MQPGFHSKPTWLLLGAVSNSETTFQEASKNAALMVVLLDTKRGQARSRFVVINHGLRNHMGTKFVQFSLTLFFCLFTTSGSYATQANTSPAVSITVPPDGRIIAGSVMVSAAV